MVEHLVEPAEKAVGNSKVEKSWILAIANFVVEEAKYGYV